MDRVNHFNVPVKRPMAYISPLGSVTFKETVSKMTSILDNPSTDLLSNEETAISKIT